MPESEVKIGLDEVLIIDFSSILKTLGLFRVIEEEYWPSLKTNPARRGDGRGEIDAVLAIAIRSVEIELEAKALSIEVRILELRIEIVIAIEIDNAFVIAQLDWELRSIWNSIRLKYR